jgi:hypothetical protein
MEMQRKLPVGVPLLLVPVTLESLTVTYVQGRWNRECQGRDASESLPVTYAQGRWNRGFQGRDASKSLPVTYGQDRWAQGCQERGASESLSGQQEAFLEAAAVEVLLVFGA